MERYRIKYTSIGKMVEEVAFELALKDGHVAEEGKALQ